MIPSTMLGRIVPLFYMLCLIFVTTQTTLAAEAGKSDSIITIERAREGYSWVMTTPAKTGVVQVILLVSDVNGNPVTEKQITGELWMPTMPMAGYPLELRFYEDQAGEYAVLAQYAHGGLWRITAGFVGDGGRRIQESFDFKLKD